METEKRLIDANAEIETIKERYCKNCNSYNGVLCGSCWADDAIGFFEDATTVDAVEVVHGEWLEEHGFDAHNNEYWVHCCSVCEEQALVDVLWREEQLTDYCPHCGAKMNGGKSEQT